MRLPESPGFNRGVHVKRLGLGCLVVGILSSPLMIPLLMASSISGPSLGAGSGQASELAKQDIPADWLTSFFAAAARYNVPWAVIAGIGKVETDFGRSTLPGVHSGANFAGAEGPMQFEPATWVAYGADCGGGRNVYDYRDAICGAAHYLAASGASTGNVAGAIWAYNHADWYVASVLSWATKYAIEVAIQAIGDLVPANLPPIIGEQLPFGQVWRPIFGSTPPEGFPDQFPWGQCTWFVASQRRVTWNGDAWMWAGNAIAAGRTESNQASVGAIVVWPTGVGYSDFGHVAVVVAVDPTSYDVAESNYLGLGIIDRRKIILPDHANPTFIAP